jgi:ribosomal protein S18 acetylase RimI-like enzyme
VTIRPATRDDIGAVLELWAEARTLAASTPDTHEGIEQLIDRDPRALLVAEIDGRLVGVVIGAWDGWRGGMYRLAVAEAFRRRGIATELVRAAEVSLQARGCRRISLLTGSDDSDAHAFWLATGYAQDPRIARFVKNINV